MIGPQIRTARKAQHLSLADVASKLDLSVATVSRIETGKQPLDVATLMKIARVLGLSPATLVGDDDSATPESERLLRRMSSMSTEERAAIWSDLADEKNKDLRTDGRLSSSVNEVLDRIDLLVSEMQALKNRVR